MDLARKGKSRWCLMYLGAGALAVIAAVVTAWHWGKPLVDRGKIVFELDQPPPHLTEELALAKALETLSRQGLDPLAWEAEADERAAEAPDGTPDVVLLRNGINPNIGHISFRNRDAWNQGHHVRRIVHMELQGRKLICWFVVPE